MSIRKRKNTSKRARKRTNCSEESGCPTPISIADLKKRKLKKPAKLRFLVREFQRLCIRPDVVECRRIKDLKAAVSRAALSRFGSEESKFPHQWRLKNRLLKRIEKKLTDPKYLKRLRSAKNFHDIYKIVREVCKPISGAGNLYIYDISLRIGASKSICPDHVYLHSGTKRGARKLGVRGHRIEGCDVRVAEIEDFPSQLQSLTCKQLEEFLCIYEDHF